MSNCNNDVMTNLKSFAPLAGVNWRATCYMRAFSYDTIDTSKCISSLSLSLSLSPSLCAVLPMFSLLLSLLYFLTITCFSHTLSFFWSPISPVSLPPILPLSFPFSHSPFLLFSLPKCF